MRCLYLCAIEAPNLFHLVYVSETDVRDCSSLEEDGREITFPVNGEFVVQKIYTHHKLTIYNEQFLWNGLALRTKRTTLGSLDLH